MKNIIITGTSRGIGFELVQQLASQGHNILALSRHTAPIELTPKQQEVKQRFIQGLQEVFRKGYDPGEIRRYTQLFSYDNWREAVALRDIIAALYWFSEEKEETFVQLVQKHLGIDIYNQ